MTGLKIRFQDESREVWRILREKGLRPFRWTLFTIAAALLCAYFLLYRAVDGKLELLQNQISAEKFRAEHAQAYEELRAHLAGYYVRMPKPEGKDGWLFKRIVESAKSLGIHLDGIAPQSESGNSEIWTVSIPVSAHLDYPHIAKWIENLENQRPALVITRLQIKRPENGVEGPALYGLEMDIAAAIPKKVPRT